MSELFDTRYGHSLSLNKLKKTTADKGVCFVSRKMYDNGIAAYVEAIADLSPNPAGELTCALSGNGVLSTFIQDRPYYTGYHVACLRPKQELTLAQKLYYCACIRANVYRYGWGRQANRTYRDILIPSPEEIPMWVDSVQTRPFDGTQSPVLDKAAPELKTANWMSFEYQELFDIEVGRGPRLKDLDGKGDTPVVTSSDSNNGRTGFTSVAGNHQGNTISVTRNGSVGEAFYQPVPFCSSEDVHVFVPKFALNPFIALFLATLIRLEKFRYTYGRKWSVDRMKKSVVSLPVRADGSPDWPYMERYIQTLPFSSQISPLPFSPTT